MTLAELTELMSRVGRRKPDLMRDRKVSLFIQECIEDARKGPAHSADALIVTNLDADALRHQCRGDL